jgi:hypothetical protein
MQLTKSSMYTEGITLRKNTRQQAEKPYFSESKHERITALLRLTEENKVALKVQKYDDGPTKSFRSAVIKKEECFDLESMRRQLQALLGIGTGDTAAVNWRAWPSQPIQSLNASEDFDYFMEWFSKPEQKAKETATIIILSLVRCLCMATLSPN